MELLEALLGRDDRRNDFDFADLIRMFSRWIIGCGCLILVLIIAAGYWVVNQGEDVITVGVVIATMLVAIASLIRSSVGQ